MIAGASPAVWRVKALLGDNVAGWLIVVALADATIGKGKARIPVAISALTGFLLWIRLGIL
jgi:hypothetical protein